MTPPLYEKFVSNHQQEILSAAGQENRARRAGVGSLLGLHGGRTAIASMMQRVTEQARAARHRAATTWLKVGVSLS